LGAPNVRAAEEKSERDCLQKRVETVIARAKAESRVRAVTGFRKAVDNDSYVVVNMHASFARSMLEDPRKVYKGYEKLVGEGIRMPAAGVNDRNRFAVSGLLFGSYGANIVYGALSLSDQGLLTYGDVACRLRTESIKDRTSFLETNSYNFTKLHKMLPGRPIPGGFRATWTTRADLAVAKLGDRIENKSSTKEWKSLLVQCDAKNRQDDEFIEAHIYDDFNVDAVESINVSTSSADKYVRMDTRICAERFAEILKRRGATP